MDREEAAQILIDDWERSIAHGMNKDYEEAMAIAITAIQEPIEAEEALKAIEWEFKKRERIYRGFDALHWHSMWELEKSHNNDQKPDGVCRYYQQATNTPLGTDSCKLAADNLEMRAKIAELKKQLAASQSEASDFATNISALESANSNLLFENTNLWKSIDALGERADKAEQNAKEWQAQYERCADNWHETTTENTDLWARINAIGERSDKAERRAKTWREAALVCLNNLGELKCGTTQIDEPQPWSWAVAELADGRMVTDGKIVLRRHLTSGGPLFCTLIGNDKWEPWDYPTWEDFWEAKWLPLKEPEILEALKLLAEDAK
jgi:regulator of replication initiation timing